MVILESHFLNSIDLMIIRIRFINENGINALTLFQTSPVFTGLPYKFFENTVGNEKLLVMSNNCL